MRPFRVSLLAALLAVGSLPLQAAVRLTYAMAGAPTPLYWPASSFPIRYQIEPRLAQSLGQATVDRAFGAWTKVDGANITFLGDGIVEGAKAGQDGKNSVSFMDSLFADQGFVAVTTYWNDSSGKLTEADIQVDPAYVGPIYPAQQTIEHEVGHLLGLDHSGVLSSIMYPFVCSEESTELDTDDKISIANLYPRIDPTLTGATLTGRVIGNDGGIFAAQVVAVNANGQPVAAALTESTGEFTLEAIPSGTYRLYAEPLDGPVGPQNLAGVYRSAQVTSFPTKFSGPPIEVDAGKVYGNLVIDDSGAPVQLNPKWIGTADVGSPSFTLYSTVVGVKAGQSVSIAVGGDGFTSGMTSFTVLNPGVHRTSDFHFAGNYLWANFEIAPDAPAGSAVVMVTSGNQTAALTGAVRVAGVGVPPRSRGARP